MKTEIALRQQNYISEQERWLDSLARKILHSKLSGITTGSIILHEAGSSYRFGKESAEDQSPEVSISVKHPCFYSDIVFGGTVGAGESYMSGSWSCSDLTALVQIILKNRHLLDELDGGTGKLMMPLHRLFHFLHRNSRSGSRKNIHAHYDLGNELFSLFLDNTMMYSCAVFESEDTPLEKASTEKLDRICRKLQIGPDDHVLEIGTGWGGFAIHAAMHYGCRVTTTTISKEQYEYASDKVRQHGLEDRISLLCEDYRNLKAVTGQKFDKLVSIEMIEAVGHQYYRDYFQTCSDLLKPDGMMLLQSITIADQHYRRALKEVDFIQRYIFPGGCLPSIETISGMVSKHTDMRFFHLDDIGEDYATTLRLWRERFFDKIDEVRKLGYSDTFIRMWEFYLCYCEGGFLERDIGTVQLLLTKPGCRRRPVLEV